MPPACRQCWLTPAWTDKPVDVVATATADDERNLEFLASEFNRSGVALVVMGVGCEIGVGIETDLLANSIHLT